MTKKRYTLGKDGLIRDYDQQLDNDQIVDRLNRLDSSVKRKDRTISNLRENEELLLDVLYGWKAYWTLESKEVI